MKGAWVRPFSPLELVLFGKEYSMRQLYHIYPPLSIDFEPGACAANQIERTQLAGARSELKGQR
jgi:hypothetical protein